MQKFEWKCPGLYKVGADVAAAVVKSCADAKGYTQPKTVVDVSRPNEAALHGCFEWQDDLAAEKWREEQARTLIRNIVTVEVRDDAQKCEPIKTFVHVVSEKDDTRGYKQTAVAVKDPSDREYILAAALRELTSFRAKYGQLKEFAELMAGIDKALTDFKEKEFGERGCSA